MNQPTEVTYKTLWATAAADLDEIVTEHLRQDWQLYGRSYFAVGRERWVQTVVFAPKPPQSKLARGVLVPGPGQVRVQ